MPARHTALALLVAVLWGLNFLAIHASLEQFPPLFLVGFRFLVLVPAVLFVPWPRVPVRWLVGYGLGTPRRALGVGTAVLGLGVVGLAQGRAESWWPFWLVVLGAFGWALGNLCSRQAAPAKPLHLIVWMSIVPPLPMFALSLVVEGPAEIGAALAGATTLAAVPAWVGLAYTVVFGTLVGSGIWVWLMSRHPAGVVAPFSMLVPIVGISAAWVVLGETPRPLEAVGGVLVIVGVLAANRRTPPAPVPEPGKHEVRTPARDLAEVRTSGTGVSDGA